MRVQLRKRTGRTAAAAGAAIAVAGFGLVPAQAASPVAVPCSVTALSAAISGATAGSTLLLAPFCTYSLVGRLPIINASNLTIIGASTTTIRRDPAATGTFSLLIVNGNNVIITGVNFAGGQSTVGGAIINTGTLAVSTSIFTDNSATKFGGAILNQGTLAVTGAIFTGNTAGSLGGGIFNELNATVRDSHFTGNSSNLNGGGIASEPPKAGLNQPGPNASPDVPQDEPIANLIVANTSFSGNVAPQGAGLYAVDQATLTNDSFTNNGNTVTDIGGGIFVDGVLTLTHSIVSGNSATIGGGVFSSDTGTLISDTVTGNTAFGDGAGIDNDGQLTLTNSKLSGNDADDEGGGLFAAGPATISGTQIFKNQASDGGGIYNDATVTLSHSPVYSNTPNNCAPPGTVPGCVG